MRVAKDALLPLLHLGLEHGQLLRFPLLDLILEFLSVFVGPWRVVDEGKLKQSAKHKRQTNARPYVDGLQTQPAQRLELRFV